MDKQNISTKIQASLRSGDKDSAQYLRNILGEVERAENDLKNPVKATEEFIQSIIKSLVKNLTISLDATKGRPEYTQQAEQIDKELSFMKTFLPKELTLEETEAAIREVIQRTGAKAVKDVMPHLKTIDGINMKTASAIVPKFL